MSLIRIYSKETTDFVVNYYNISTDKELDTLADDFQKQPKHIYSTFEEYLLHNAPRKLLIDRRHG